MKPGRKPNSKVYDILPKLMKLKTFYTPDKLKQLYKESTGEGIGYDTIKNCLNNMVENREIKEIIVNATDKRKTVVYSIE